MFTVTNDTETFILLNPESTTVEPRYNEESRDWQNWFAITRFRYIEVNKIVRFTEDFVKQRIVISRFHCIKVFYHQM